MKNKKEFLTFLYHEAVDSLEDSGFQRSSAIPYKHKVSEFYDNVDIIASNAQPIITVRELLNYNQATLLTFDDGGKSSMIIADCLEQYNFKGHFFITTSMIGSPHFLTEAEILELHNRGHMIGSHSHSHPNVFKSLSYDAMLDEWKTSKSILENILSTPIDICSVPGGDASKETYLSAKDSGYKILFDSEPVLASRSMDGLLILGRICPKQGTSYQTVLNYCRRRGIRRAFLIRNLKNFVKVLISPVYLRMYR